MTPLFQKVTKQSRQMDEKGDCAVRAVAIACGYEDDYEGVHYAFGLFGRKRRRGTMPDITRRVVHSLKCTMVDVTYKFEEARTVRTLGRALRQQWTHHNYLISVNRHLLAATDGQVHDWTKNRLHRIKRVWKIVEVSDEFLAAEKRNVVFTPEPSDLDMYPVKEYVTHEYYGRDLERPVKFRVPVIYLSNDKTGRPVFVAKEVG